MSLADRLAKPVPPPVPEWIRRAQEKRLPAKETAR